MPSSMMASASPTESSGALLSDQGTLEPQSPRKPELEGTSDIASSYLLIVGQ